MKSVNWKMWKATLDLRTCLGCKDMHGKIYRIKDVVTSHPPLHPRCRCLIERLKSIRAGLGTKDGTGGADINYKFGFRGNDRIVFSNDGLIFVTYDHYKTFIEFV